LRASPVNEVLLPPVTLPVIDKLFESRDLNVNEAIVVEESAHVTFSTPVPDFMRQGSVADSREIEKVHENVPSQGLASVGSQIGTPIWS
jgi:hypothetical protein